MIDLGRMTGMGSTPVGGGGVEEAEATGITIGGRGGLVFWPGVLG